MELHRSITPLEHLPAPRDVDVAPDAEPELLEGLGPVCGAAGVGGGGGQAPLHLLHHHVKHLPEVLPGGAHVAPGLVEQQHAVAEELLERVLGLEEHLVEGGAVGVGLLAHPQQGGQLPHQLDRRPGGRGEGREGRR